jgi:hypothetical protein
MKTILKTLWERCNQSPYVRWQLRFIRAATGCEGASLLLLDAGQADLVFCCAVGLNSEGLVGEGNYAHAMRVSLDATVGINSMAALYGKPICMQRPDERHNKEVDQKFSQKTHSVFAVPVATMSGIVGTVSAINAHCEVSGGDRHYFQDEDREAVLYAAEAIRCYIIDQIMELQGEPQDLSTP